MRTILVFRIFTLKEDKMQQKVSNQSLGRDSIEDFKRKKKLPVYLVLDNVRSLHNVGSVFRTADAFSIQEIILCGITGTPPHREIQKTALGATESVAWRYFKSTLDAMAYLKDQQVCVYSMEQTTNSIFLQDLTLHRSKSYALVFGNEVEGVLQEVIDMSDGVIEIPQFGTKHSFNISVSVGIVCWQFYRLLT